MYSSRVLVSFVSLVLSSAVVGCSHQAPPAGTAAQVAHPSIGFAVKGPRAEPEPSPAEADPLDRQDKPIVDAMHGFNHESPR
jgi:hypothetical protein